MWGKLSYLAFQVDPYDYDTILFILNLVKELSQETASTVDKVWNQLIVASGQLPSLCWYDFCTLWFKHAASRLNRVELSKDVVGHNDVILRRFRGLRHLLQSWKTRTYGIVVEISFLLVNLPWQTSPVFFFLLQGIQLLDYLYQYERKAVPTSYERSFYSSSQNTDSEKVRT